MGRGPPGTALPALVKALNDPDYYVRLFAAVALGMIGPEAKPAVPALRECFRDPRRHLQKEAAGALGQLGPAAKDAIPDLIHALSDADLGSFASQALAKIGPLAVPALKAALNGQDEPARSYAAQALKAIESKPAAKTGEPPIPVVAPGHP